MVSKVYQKKLQPRYCLSVTFFTEFAHVLREAFLICYHGLVLIVVASLERGVNRESGV